MTDAIHFVVLAGSLGMIGVGLWMIAPYAMFLGVGSILLGLVVAARLTANQKPRKVA